MNDRRPQDLAEAFAGMITMMLMTIRARGWRGLKEWPKIWRFTMELRRGGQALADLMADFRAGKLAAPAPAPEPVPWSAPAAQEAAWAQDPGAPCPAARPEPPARDRRPVAKRPSVRAAAAVPDRPRATDRVRFASARSRPRGRTAAWLRPPRRALDPFAAFRRPTGIFATGRSP